MKSFKLLSTTLCAVILLVLVMPVLAADETPASKVPVDAFGLGVVLSADGGIGPSGIYFVNSSLAIGMQFGFVYDGGTNILGSTTDLYIAPFVRYYFAPTNNYLQPFLLGNFEVNSGSVNVKSQNNTAGETVESSTTTSFNISLGGEWFAVRGVGISGGIKLLRFEFSPSRFIFGIGTPFIGAEWFFN